MVDDSILATDAYKLIYEEYKDSINQGPTYICDICWKFEFHTNVISLNSSKYEADLFDRCKTEKSEWICKTCDKYLGKGKLPVQAQANNLSLNPPVAELDLLCRLELMLISQIIPFMEIGPRARGIQCGIKGQCTLVPTDLTKIQKNLPRTNNDDWLISVALKRRLSDSNVHTKQIIRPALVNKALRKLAEINPLYQNVVIDESWENVTKEADPELWDMLTNEDSKKEMSKSVDKFDYLTDSDDENNDNVDFSTNKHETCPALFPTYMHEKNGPSISINQIVNIAPGEGQIPVSFNSEPDWEALCYIKEYPTAQHHFNTKRDVPITVSKYIHARLKSCDGRFASNPHYIFQCLEWVERTAIAASIHFAERKQYQTDINAGQLLSQENVSRMISNDLIFASFKNIRGTPQYFHNMSLDILAKCRQFGKPTFFITGSCAEFQWTELIKIVAKQYGEILTDKQIESMDTETKCMYLKRNPVTIARQIDYIFQKLYS